MEKETFAAGKVWTNIGERFVQKSTWLRKAFKSMAENSALDFALAGQLMPGLLMATLYSRQPGEVAKRSTTWEIAAIYVFLGVDIRNDFHLVQGLTP